MVILSFILAFENYSYIIDLTLSYFIAIYWLRTKISAFILFLSPFIDSYLFNYFFGHNLVYELCILLFLGKKQRV